MSDEHGSKEDFNPDGIDYSFIAKADWKEIIHMMFSNWNPYPSKAYCESVGWLVNADGTIETPGLGRVPTSDLCEVKELEKLYEVSDLEHLYKLEADNGG